MTDKLDLTSLRDAVDSLNESLAVVSEEAWFAAQSHAVKNTLVAGVIQNFEFVYELCIKVYQGTFVFIRDARDLLARLETCNA